jgi:hypothetical protein
MIRGILFDAAACDATAELDGLGTKCGWPAAGAVAVADGRLRVALAVAVEVAADRRGEGIPACDLPAGLVPAALSPEEAAEDDRFGEPESSENAFGLKAPEDSIWSAARSRSSL